MRQLLLMAICVGVWASPVSAQFVAPGGSIPVVANTPGVGGTFWRSDVSVLNINDIDTSIVMFLLPEIRGGTPEFEPMITEPIQLPARSQLTMTNVVQSQFGLVDTKGALSVISTNGAPLVMSSRAYTFDGEGGSYGQDVHAVLVANTGWTSGIQHNAFFRTNVGIFLPVNPVPPATTVFTVTVYDADGEEAGSGTYNYSVAGVQQRSVGSFGIDNLSDGYVVISCSDPSVAWYAYSSTVDQSTGDAVYRAARGRQSDLP